MTRYQLKGVLKAIRNGLNSLQRPPPRTLSEWADEHFYLSAESSYHEMPWTTQPYQKFPMNVIGNDDVRIVNIIKSARTGYTQMIRAAAGYFLEHKKRNQCIFVPKNEQADGFMKAFIESMIRDVPVIKVLAPWYGRKHRDSTLGEKLFSNGKKLYLRGGGSSKNYREISVDNVVYDELSGFEEDIEKEGSPTFLGDKRNMGSSFPKSVRGSTPFSLPDCQITKAVEESPTLFRCYIPCPECYEYQHLVFTNLKWESRTSPVTYKCEHCNKENSQEKWQESQNFCFYMCSKTGVKSYDGIEFFTDENSPTDPPTNVSIHFWSVYSPYVRWERIVEEFYLAKSDPVTFKTFKNTTLGEVWDDEYGTKTTPEELFSRREHYKAQLPVDNGYLVMSVDTQDYYLEWEISLYTAGEESWSVAHGSISGNLSQSDPWEALQDVTNRTFKSDTGVIYDIGIVMIDSGGHFTDEVYRFCKKQPSRYFAVKGHNVPGKPIVNMPEKPNKHGIFLIMIGTDTAKEVISGRLTIKEPGAGYIHFPVSDDFDQHYFNMLCAEKRKRVLRKGRYITIWDAEGKRNEPFDLKVYGLSGIRLRKQFFGLNLEQLVKISKKPKIIKSKKGMTVESAQI